MIFSRLSVRERNGLVVAFIFVLLALVDRLVVFPITERIKKLNEEIKLEEKRVARNLHNLSQKAEVLKEYQRYADYVKKEKSDEEEIASLLNEIESIASSTRIYLVNMKPQPIKQVDFYKSYAIEMEVEGEMELIIKFLYALQKSEQLIRVKRMRLRLPRPESNVIRAYLSLTKVLIP